MTEVDYASPLIAEGASLPHTSSNAIAVIERPPGTATMRPVQWEVFERLLREECKKVVADVVSRRVVAKYIDDLSQEVEKKTPREAQEVEKMTQKEANVQDGASYHGHSKTSEGDCGDADMIASATKQASNLLFCRAEKNRREAGVQSDLKPCAFVQVQSRKGEQNFDKRVRFPLWAHFPSLDIASSSTDSRETGTLLNPGNVRLEIVKTGSDNTTQKVFFSELLKNCTTVVGRIASFLNEAAVKCSCSSLYRLTSKMHMAILVDEDGRLFLMDLESAHGTYLMRSETHQEKYCDAMPDNEILYGHGPRNLNLQSGRHYEFRIGDRFGIGKWEDSEQAFEFRLAVPEHKSRERTKNLREAEAHDSRRRNNGCNSYGEEKCSFSESDTLYSDYESIDDSEHEGKKSRENMKSRKEKTKKKRKHKSSRTERDRSTERTSGTHLTGRQYEHQYRDYEDDGESGKQEMSDWHRADCKRFYDRRSNELLRYDDKGHKYENRVPRSTRARSRSRSHSRDHSRNYSRHSNERQYSYSSPRRYKEENYENETKQISVDHNKNYRGNRERSYQQDWKDEKRFHRGDIDHRDHDHLHRR